MLYSLPCLFACLACFGRGFIHMALAGWLSARADAVAACSFYVCAWFYSQLINQSLKNTFWRRRPIASLRCHLSVCLSVSLCVKTRSHNTTAEHGLTRYHTCAVMAARRRVSLPTDTSRNSKCALRSCQSVWSLFQAATRLELGRSGSRRIFSLASLSGC
jgi:hypothetical protein